MNLWKLSWAYLRFNPLTTVLNVLLLALGMATIVVLLLFSHQLETTLSRNAQGIDLVVGAKGSPLQLILSSIYHADVPTGNIPYAEAETWQNHRLVKQAIPLALGDNFQGFRIVGTTVAYPEHYGADLAVGQYWEQGMQAVLGATVAQQTGLSVGDTFVGTHGIAEAGEVHDTHHYAVTGILAATHTVLDRLVLTDVTSVWEVHGHEHGADHAHADHDAQDSAAHTAESEPHAHDAHTEHDHDHHDEHMASEHDHDHAEHAAESETHAHDAHSEHHHDHHDEHMASEHEHDHAVESESHQHDSHAEHDHHEDNSESKHAFGHDSAEQHSHTGHAHEHPEALEITALLLQYQSPLAAVSLPRLINSHSALQSASPAFETARLLQLVGIGIDTLRVFGGILIVAAALGVFIALSNALRERRYDLAIMRSLGASQTQVFWLLVLEGLVISLLGAVVGMGLGHGLIAVLGTSGVAIGLGRVVAVRNCGISRHRSRHIACNTSCPHRYCRCVGAGVACRHSFAKGCAKQYILFINVFTPPMP